MHSHRREDSGPARAPATGPGADASRNTDVLVVGGGISGASTAYHLSRAGLRVVLAERNRLARGVTSQAVGLLSPPLRQPYQQVVHDLGGAAALALWEFSLRSVEGLSDLLAARGEAGGVELDRSGGHLLAEPHTDHVVAGSFEAMHRAGLPVRWLSADDVRQRTGGRGFTGGYVVDKGGALDPALATRAIARAAQAAGAEIIEGVHVREVEPCQGGFRATTSAGEILATAVVYSAHLDGTGLLGELGAELVPVTAQAFLTAPLPIRFRGGFATDWKANVWRQRPDGRLVVSGWRHHALSRAYGQIASVDRLLQNDLRAWFESAFPALAPLPIEGEWSGVWGWTPDFLPLVGGLPGRSGEWVVTGFGGGGFAFAFEAARAVAHAIVGDEPVPGAELLDPSRLTAFAAPAVSRRA
jgi:sarcosine oxidase